MKVTVDQMIRETADVKRFRLRATDGRELPRFSAGAHIATTAGGFERNYSLVDGDREFYEIAIRRESGSRGGSVYWHDRVSEGDEVEIRCPKNHFPLSFRAKHHVFFAAGIGITPFMAMMRELSERGASFELHYAARSRADCAFYDAIQRRFGSNACFYFSKTGHRLTTERLLELPIGSHVYFCGPESFIHDFTEAALSLGYPKGSLHHERFAAKPVPNPQPFTLVLAKTGQTLHVPKNKTVLEVLRETGVKVPYSCRVGACGTCEVEVLKGKIDHYDSFLSDEEREKEDTMLTCVSRCRSGKLILNL
ncbi:MAG TPA: PDR/VanB family oxidoreductase [Bacillales bacterium]|nr:PDR/VanB family oxidoreductase [Bacillales bacterium]